MRRVLMGLVMVAGCVCPSAAPAQTRPVQATVLDLSGEWVLNRDQSQFPKAMGFGMDSVPPGGGSESASVEGGRSGNPRSLTTRPQTEAESRNTIQIVDEALNPSIWFIVQQTATTVRMTDARERTRVFHPDGRTESQSLDAGPMRTVTRWESGRLVVRYRVAQGREVRVSWSRRANPDQLVVQSEIVESGGHDSAVRVYDRVEPGLARREAARRGAGEATPGLPDLPSARVAPPSQIATFPGGSPGGAAPQPAPAGVAPSAAPIDSRADAELIGLKDLGLVVEGFGPEAAHCGIRKEAVESAVTMALTHEGLKVARNADEDSYLYVHVMTTAMTTGFCFSRFDATIYTMVTTTMPHGTTSVLVPVSVLHKGGQAGGGAGGHGEAVVKGVREFVTQFASRIAAANK